MVAQPVSQPVRNDQRSEVSPSRVINGILVIGASKPPNAADVDAFVSLLGAIAKRIQQEHHG